MGVCDELNVDDHVRYCAVLTGYAESDYIWNAVSKHPTSSGYYSEGVFQQTLPWWTNDHWDVDASCRAFLKRFRSNAAVNDIWRAVKDCHDVQRWGATPHREDLVAFLTAPQTVNYTDRMERVEKIVQTRKLPVSQDHD